MESSNTIYTLSRLGDEAASDMDRILSVLNLSSLNKENFVKLLDGTISSHDNKHVAEIFDRLVQMCLEAELIASSTTTTLSNKVESCDEEYARKTRSTALQLRELDGNALRCLYTFHPSYTKCSHPMDTALEVTNWFKDHFKANEEKEKDAESDIDELMLSYHSMTISHHSNTYELEVLENKSKDGKGNDQDSQLLASSLHPHSIPLDIGGAKKSIEDINTSTRTGALFNSNLRDRIFAPFHTKSFDFVLALEKAVMNHEAVNHHVLRSLSMGSWGGLSETTSHLANFLGAYQCFTSKFCSYLSQSIVLVGQVDPSGSYLEILKENSKEEQGHYDNDALEMIKNLGLDVEHIDGVAHRDLYKTCVENIRKAGGCRPNQLPISEAECHYIAEPLLASFDNACNADKGANAATAMAAMYFGSELVAPTIYSKLSKFVLSEIKNGGGPGDDECTVTKQDLAFFLLHMEIDVEHADKMREIIVGIAEDENTRIKMAHVADNILKARVEFYNRFIETSFPPTGHSGEDSAKLYNKQSQNWVRKGATCLSDFTGRPVVFEMCSAHVSGSYILDVGCGEGYGARELIKMGAKRVVGFDVSNEMVERAKTNPERSSHEIYQTCDAENIMETLHMMPASLGIVPGRMLDRGCFDLAVAIFLFNYTSISKMKSICQQIFNALKPGGHFIFSVPHPFMLNAHSGDESVLSTFTFAKGDVKPDSYFSLRDRKFAGVIRTIDGRDLNVKMLFKSISDYTETLNSVGFNVDKMHEACVLPQHVAAHPKFFASVKDSPLHLVFDVAKPTEYAAIGRIPKAIKWSLFERANAERILSITMPTSVSEELLKVAIEAFDKGGLTEKTFTPTNKYAARLTNVAAFAGMIRNRLVDQTGVVHLTGMDYDMIKANTDSEGANGRAKLAYYIFSSFIGKVDGSARGRLFDVVDKGLDIKDDNVLFSVSNAEAPWHTDGASADKAYDGMGLLCLNPATDGGKLHFSNVPSALASLKKNLPKFILNELFRPLPRDILENGSGDGVGDSLRFTRRADLFKLRVRHNSFPIFEEGISTNKHEDELILFRYMRQWIESGHKNGDVSLSPLLELAMDSLDSALDDEKVGSVDMKAGDMLYCNNMSFAHARSAFINDNKNTRHNVRVWIKLQGYE